MAQVFITQTPQETARLGQGLGQRLQGGEVIAFRGAMGAGKTTFTRGISQGLGSVDPVSSPTYAIVNLYRGPIPLAHFDAWRMEGEDDLEAAGFYDYRATGTVIALEWSERVNDLLEPPVIRVDIQTLPNGSRQITLENAPELRP